MEIDYVYRINFCYQIELRRCFQGGMLLNTYIFVFFDIFDVFPNVERDYSAKSILRVNIEFNIEQFHVSAKILLTSLALLTLKRSSILAFCVQ